jgi:phage FluMu protein Com
MKGVLDMFISFECPHCGTTLQDTAEFAGRKKSCPRCKEKVIVPAIDAARRGEAKEQADKG